MTEVSTELVVPVELLDVSTGEVLEASPANAHRVLVQARAMKDRIQDVIANAQFYLSEESRRLGTKTIHTPDGDLTASGGVSTEYDLEALESLLREAGLPEARIREVIVEEVKTTYKLDRRVLKQLTASNEDYKAAAELASREVETPLRWSAK